MSPQKINYTKKSLCGCYTTVWHYLQDIEYMRSYGMSRCICDCHLKYYPKSIRTLLLRIEMRNPSPPIKRPVRVNEACIASYHPQWQYFVTLSRCNILSMRPNHMGDVTYERGKCKIFLEKDGSDYFQYTTMRCLGCLF